MRKYVHTYFLLILLIITAAIWYAISYFDSHQNLLVTFFDIGQGDSILTSVTQSQICSYFGYLCLT